MSESEKSVWARLDDIFLALPPEARETSDLIVWTRSLEGQGRAIEEFPSFVAQMVGVVYSLEMRLVALEKAVATK